MENVVIIGSGISGLTAAIYASRASLNPVVISGKGEGGQLMLTTSVDNFPCFPDGIMGPDMISRAKDQAKKFGARFVDGNAESIERKDNFFLVKSEEKPLESKTVIVATGASARTLGLDSEKKYWARGVHTCATCDGFFYKGKELAVIGGGDSAMEESLFLSKHASKVTIIHRRDSFRASKIMQEKVKSNPKISVKWNAEVAEVLGDGSKVEMLKIRNSKDQSLEEFKTDGMFLAIGHIPSTGFVKGLVDLDDQGYIITDGVKTKIKGLFAAGDCVDRVYRQAVTAAGLGCQAALEAEKYLETVKA